MPTTYIVVAEGGKDKDAYHRNLVMSDNPEVAEALRLGYEAKLRADNTAAARIIAFKAQWYKKMKYPRNSSAKQCHTGRQT